VNVKELRSAIAGLPDEAVLTVAVSPDELYPVEDIRTHMGHDEGELCAPCEFVLLAGEAWLDIDPDDYPLTLAS
jgi:hypothetical protein